MESITATISIPSLGTVEVFEEDFFAQGDEEWKAIEEIHQIWLELPLSADAAFQKWIFRNF